MITLKEFIDKYLWETIDYDNVYGHQCVDLIKAYTHEVLWIRLWTFWGSAKSGWENSSNTFPKEQWEKVVNDFNQLNQIPKEWDIVFWSTGQYWHVAIWLDWTAWSIINVLEQNVWNWDWIWDDDAIEDNNRTYHDILWWYHLKDSTTEIDIVEENQKLIKENQKLKEENAILSMKVWTAIKILEK
mgnify:CR=1 FL=1